MSVSTTLRWSVSEGKISPSELESIDARSEKRKKKRKKNTGSPVLRRRASGDHEPERSHYERCSKR